MALGSRHPSWGRSASDSHTVSPEIARAVEGRTPTIWEPRPTPPLFSFNRVITLENKGHSGPTPTQQLDSGHTPEGKPRVACCATTLWADCIPIPRMYPSKRSGVTTLHSEQAKNTQNSRSAPTCGPGSHIDDANPSGWESNDKAPTGRYGLPASPRFGAQQSERRCGLGNIAPAEQLGLPQAHSSPTNSSWSNRRRHSPTKRADRGSSPREETVAVAQW